jgi:hypothetical protein
MEEVRPCLGEEGFGQGAADGCAVGNGAAQVACDIRRAVGSEEFAAQPEGVALDDRQTRDGGFAGAVEGQKEAALGGEAEAGGVVVNGGQEGLGRGVVQATLDPDGTLGDGGEHFLGCYGGAGDVGHAEARQAGHGEEGRVGDAFVEFAHPGLDVAAEFDEMQVGAAQRELGAAAEGGGADGCALGEVGDRGKSGGDEGIANVGAGEVAVEDQALGLLGRHVLHRMDGDVDGPVEKGILDFAREQALAADLTQRLVLDLVASDLDDHDFEGVFRQREGRHQAAAGFMRLPQGEGGASGADLQGTCGGGQIIAHGARLSRVRRG